MFCIFVFNGESIVCEGIWLDVVVVELNCIVGALLGPAFQVVLDVSYAGFLMHCTLYFASNADACIIHYYAWNKRFTVQQAIVALKLRLTIVLMLCKNKTTKLVKKAI